MRPEDVPGEQTAPWRGVVYELECFIDRAVFDRAWPTEEDPQGAALEEITLGPSPDVPVVTDVPPTVSQ